MAEPIAVPGEVIATVDLGSNSFHLLIARVEHGEMRAVVTQSEKVQLAAGLNKGRLSQAAMTRGWDCLRQFRQILDASQPMNLRVVGTNTLRAAKNAGEFVSQASAILGQPVEIISGIEEARLIYLGVAHTLADDELSRLVIDIGGGSTELIIGQRFESKLLDSLYMGCVGYREQFFANGRISGKRFDKAYGSASLEVLRIRDAFCRRGWQEVVGSAGTLNAISAVLREETGSGLITCAGLALLRDRLLKVGHVDELKSFAGLKPHRYSTFPAGIAICSALFDRLNIDVMRVSPGALREGLVYDLMGRMSHEDVRERTILAMRERAGVDPVNAERVLGFAQMLFQQVRDAWGLTAADGELLYWAAQIHEVGLSIAHSQFHKHGQYLIENADLPGFSRTQQRQLALLVRGHRRKFPATLFDELPSDQRLRLQRLCILLRLAVLFKYVLALEGEPRFQLAAEDYGLTLSFAAGWQEQNPLTMAELEQEQRYLKAVGFHMRIAWCAVAEP